MLAPIRKLLNPPTLYKWEGEHMEAWRQAKTYILSELFPVNVELFPDSDSEADIDDALTCANLQNLGMTKATPKRFMTPGAPSETEGQATENKNKAEKITCNPPPAHPFCSIHLTKGAPINTCGLSEEVMKAFNISPPITPRIFVKNLAYGVSEAQIVEVFSMCGKIVEATLYRHDNGESKERATVQYAHPLEAVQAIVMFSNARFKTKKLMIEQDRIGPQPTMTKKMPDGLVNVGDGIGMGGSRLRIRYMNGDIMIHHPECEKQGPHPILGIEENNLGGVVRLDSVFEANNWPDSTLAQGFADTMYDKLQHLVNAGYNCVREGVPQAPHIKELIKIAQKIQDEFATRIIKRDAWVKYGDPDMETETAGGLTDSPAYLGTSYYVDLREPRTKNEFKNLIYQLEALSDHFDELTYHLRKLKPMDWTETEWPNNSSKHDGDTRKKIWNRDQVATFAEIKDALFDIIEGKHPWTRNTKIQAYHPCSVGPFRHTDPHGIIIQTTFGGSGGEHIMILRGYIADHRFRDLTLSLVIMDRHKPLRTLKTRSGTPLGEMGFSRTTFR